MLTKEMLTILSTGKDTGWVAEPEAKRLFALAGLEIPRFVCTDRTEEAVKFAREIGYPVVVKVVSPGVVHDSESGGVVKGISTNEALVASLDGIRQISGFAGAIIEETIEGIELIAGAKMDEQFGPTVLIGTGGTGAKICRDVTFGMAPLTEVDVEWMLNRLKGFVFLNGFRIAESFNIKPLITSVVRFSDLVMDLVDVMETIDVNLVVCSGNRCVIENARIRLNPEYC
ncbi:MAG: hypothetical protein A4E65_02692 [Syntrophorhabdus sp. PtaU1.Bin153]|nr:MAG: hypothetical protein A4E65_02692 [Syntrophorhabdus sp. PtaU1.Bin153]